MRLDAIEDMMAHQHETDVLRARLGKLPDVEKLLAKIFTYSIKHKVKAIYFEDVSIQKMKEFRQLLQCFDEFENTIESFSKLNLKNALNSKRLKTLLTPIEDGGLFPSTIKHELAEFKQMIVWKLMPNEKTGKKEEIPEPQSGIDSDFDEANAIVNEFKD